MDQSPLVEEWRVYGQKFLEDFSRTFPLKLAVWLKEADGGPWELHIASDSITDQNRREAFIEIVQSARRTGFDFSRVILKRADDPRVQAILEHQPRQPRVMGTYYDQALHGVSGADAAYFYPSANLVAS
jgi:hypothetical protein